MTQIRYRPAKPGDVPKMADLFLRTVANLYARNNQATQPPPKPSIITAYEHVRSTGIFQLAETDHAILGIAGAVVRDSLWFLSAFWVDPEAQRQGVGMPLLRAVQEEGRREGASTFFTWSSIDPTAMGAYMKTGMYPGYPIFTFEGAPRVDGLSDCCGGEDLQLAEAMDMDLAIRGTRREADHLFWKDSLKLSGRVVRSGNRASGYFYHGKGWLGPVCWRIPEDAEAVLGTALSEASAESPRVRLAVPGINRSALRFVLGSGLRIVSHALFLSSAPFGQLDRYLPSGQTLY